MSNITLATQVSASLASADQVTLNASSVKAVSDSLVEFNLQADETIDVKRLPTDIVNLTTFLDHLRKIKAAIEADNLAGNTYRRDREGHIEGNRPSYMLDGSLKRYKLGVCCLHAIGNCLADRTTAITTGTINTYVNLVFTHASGHPPGGLGTGGARLWSATFSAAAPRTKIFLALILGFMTEAPDAKPTAAPPTPPAPLTTSTVAAGGLKKGP